MWTITRESVGAIARKTPIAIATAFFLHAWIMTATMKIADSSADHSVRRFIRPVLMRDPQVEQEKAAQDVTAQVMAQDTDYQPQAKAATESTPRNATPDPSRGRAATQGAAQCAKLTDATGTRRLVPAVDQCQRNTPHFASHPS